MVQDKIVWTIKELVLCIRDRQLNNFDANMGVSGKRGDGKSTLIFKILNSFKADGFRPKKHQVYSRDDVIKLLSSQKFGFCWDDEAINSGYKREFQFKGQHDLIKIVTNYRDNYNIYASALPFFYSLDKDLRELIFIHIHIIQRGVAVILMPVASHVHSQDPWDTKNNKKIEEQETRRIKKNPDLKFRYMRFSTFAGYLYFGDMTKKQREIYSLIKTEKRAKSFSISEGVAPKLEFHEKLYKFLLDGLLTKKSLQEMCLLEGKKYSVIATTLGTMLRDKGVRKTLSQLFIKDNINIKEKKIEEPITMGIPKI